MEADPWNLPSTLPIAGDNLYLLMLLYQQQYVLQEAKRIEI